MTLEALHNQTAQIRRRAMRLYNKAIGLKNPIGDIICLSIESLMDEDLPQLQDQLSTISRENGELELNYIIIELEMLEDILNG